MATPCLHFFPADFADGPNHALSPIASFLSRLSLGKVAELERPRRHPKAFGIPSNLLTGTPSSVPCPRSDACRAKGVPSMCDYSLHLVASRAAKVGDELVTTKFNNSLTRGFAAIGEPNVTVCLLPGTEVAFEKEVECDHVFKVFGSQKVGEKLARFRQVDKDQPNVHHDALEFPNGESVLVSRLREGQHATVLQLPASPRSVNETEKQKRGSLVN